MFTYTLYLHLYINCYITCIEGRFLVLISVRGSVDPRAVVRLGRIRSTKKSNYLIGNQTRYLKACSIVLQPAILPRAPIEGHI
jgi:hypothetical protein